METEQNCNILTPHSIGHNSVSFPFSWAAQPGAWEPSLSGTCSHSSIFFPTDWTSCALSYIIVWCPPSSCGRHKSHSFNLSTVKVIFWYSSTGCTCYLHRCISYFDSPAGSEVNIQHTVLLKSARILRRIWRPKETWNQSDFSEKPPVKAGVKQSHNNNHLFAHNYMVSSIAIQY